MENLEIYNSVREVPKEAQREIKGGKLKGFTDINPMWRIQKLTELFGVCGIGWYVEVAEKWSETYSNGDVNCFVSVNLYVKVDGEWSKPIHGTGGSHLMAFGGGKLQSSDEGYKMAETDALSVACKYLGIGANIYWNEGTKYTERVTAEEAEKNAIKELTRIFNDFFGNDRDKKIMVSRKYAGIYGSYAGMLAAYKRGEIEEMREEETN